MSDVVNYSCPNCGGKLVFSAQKQKFACEWCLSEFDENEMKKLDSAENAQFSTADEKASESFENNANLYVCDSCGAEIISDENTAATFCYYCHSPVTLKGRLSGEYCPSKVIPFKRTKIDAENKFKEWVGKKWFVPTDFKSAENIEKITGMYVPFWVASCRVTGHMTADAERTFSHRHGKTTTTKHDVYLLERGIVANLEGVPADGSKKIDDHLMDTIEPFDYKEAKRFSMTYLQGFYADKYDVDKEAVFPRIKKRTNEFVRQKLMESTLGYETVVPIEQSSNITNVKWDYMMFPVWFLNYKHGGKDYSFAMNGQTGKFCGELPISKIKILIGMVVTGLIFGLLGDGLIAFLLS